jgi:hypothetical protein
MDVVRPITVSHYTPSGPLVSRLLPKDYARPSPDKQRGGELIDLVSDIGLGRKSKCAE